MSRKLPPESVLQKIRKIAALVERGCKGEAAAAQHLLDEQLSRYGLTMSDILEDKKERRVFQYSNKQQLQVLAQVLYHRFGSNSEEMETAGLDSRHKRVLVNLTDIDYIDCSAEWEYYRQAFVKETRTTEKALLLAFFKKFNLWDITPSESAPERTTQEEREAWNRAYDLLSSIETAPYRKLLEKA